jgi:acetylornithine deacetylase/succinyl-diaminopimelate desuccinylase family protein
MSDVPEDGLVDLLTEIIARETVNPPGNESVLANYFVERFEASSVEFDIELQEVQPGRPNVIARAGDPAKGSLLLTGHMDVVPVSPDDWSGDPFEPRRENGRLIGRGTADMKGALAVKLVAAEAFLDEHDDTGEVILAFVVDEEAGGMGTEALVENGIKADAAIIGEPTQLQVAIAEYGAVGYSLAVSGESGHSGRPDLATNAIDGLRRVLDQVKLLDDDVRIDEHDLFTPGPTISITEIEGGLAHNVVPDEATATLDWRTLPDPDREPEFFDEQLAEAIENASLDGGSVDVECEREFFSPGSAVDPDAEIAEATLAAAREVGIDADRTGFNAVSDARFLTQAGIPTVLFGPGSVEEDAHTVEESVSIGELQKTVETYRGILDRFLRIH